MVTGPQSRVWCGPNVELKAAAWEWRETNWEELKLPSIHPSIHPYIHPSVKLNAGWKREGDGGRRRPARAVRVRSRVAVVGGCRAARDPTRPSVGPSVRRSLLRSPAQPALPSFLPWLAAWSCLPGVPLSYSSLSSGNKHKNIEHSRAKQSKARQGAPDSAYFLLTTHTYNIHTYEPRKPPIQPACFPCSRALVVLLASVCPAAAPSPHPQRSPST